MSANVMGKTQYVKLGVILYISVLYPVLACNYIVGKWNSCDFCMLPGLLRIMGSFMIDLIGLYFTVLGYEAAQKVHSNSLQATSLAPLSELSGNANERFMITDEEERDDDNGSDKHGRDKDGSDKHGRDKDEEQAVDAICDNCREQSTNHISRCSEGAVTMDAALPGPQACETKGSATHLQHTVININTCTTTVNNALHNEISTGTLVFTQACEMIQTVLPDLLVATFLHFTLLVIFCRKCWWSWLYTLMMPLCLSTLVNINSADNAYAYVNEAVWVLQHDIIFMIFAPMLVQSASKLLQQTNLLCITLASIWIGTFFQMFVMLSHPYTINIVVRNIFTHAAFFLVGNLLCMCSDSLYTNTRDLHEQRRRVQDLRDAMTPKLVTLPVVIITFLYLHHAYPYTDTRHCFTVFAGAPCLWTFDVCNARFIPCLVLVVAMVMQASTADMEKQDTTTQNLCSEHFYKIAQHIEVGKVSLLCYASIASFLFSFTLQKTIGNIMFDLLYLVVPVQMVLVTVLCVATHGHAQKAALPLTQHITRYLQGRHSAMLMNNT
jgi:hypothetical protein